MAKYLIHAIPKRLWYVNDYIIPSMVAQGIDRNDIQIWCDTNRKGCLEMFMQSCKQLPAHGSTWHLQDDILISSKFREETEKNRRGLVCGLCTVYDHDNEPGCTDVFHMWYSFPCIKIPNQVARGCAEWFYTKVVNDYSNAEYQRNIRNKKYDDSFFRDYVRKYHPNLPVTNLAPNIVEHVDYLIGGTAANYGRAQTPISRYWYEPELTDKLMSDMMEMCLRESTS